MGKTTNPSGMHRAKLWQIGGFAFNNTATNLYMFMMNFSLLQIRIHDHIQ